MLVQIRITSPVMICNETHNFPSVSYAFEEISHRMENLACMVLDP